MATKTITITNDAYERLASFKGEKDSFSDTIKKLTSKYSLIDLVGVLSKEEANNMHKHVNELRKRARKEMMSRGLKLT